MRLHYFIALILLWSLAACATQPPRYRSEAIATLERVKRAGGESLLPAEFRSVVEAYVTGESFLINEEPKDAERYFYLTLLKGALLEKAIQEEKARQKEAARLAEEQKKQAELERLAQKEAIRLAQAEAQALLQKETVEVERKKAKPQLQKEYALVISYTVKRGESLPLIASHPEVYSDRNLWPLIYRANRDQISDPRHIWPGQVLRIPRNLVRDDIAEAKRYSQERQLH